MARGKRPQVKPKRRCRLVKSGVRYQPPGDVLVRGIRLPRLYLYFDILGTLPPMTRPQVIMIERAITEITD